MSGYSSGAREPRPGGDPTRPPGRGSRLAARRLTWPSAPSLWRSPSGSGRPPRPGSSWRGRGTRPTWPSPPTALAARPATPRRARAPAGAGVHVAVAPAPGRRRAPGHPLSGPTSRRLGEAPGGAPSESAPLLIYLALHGTVDDRGRPCLLADDAGPHGAGSIPVTDVLSRLRTGTLAAKKKVVFLDATAVSADWHLGMLSNEFARALEALDAQIARDPNLVVVSASGPGEQSWPDPAAGTTAFGPLRGRRALRQGRPPVRARPPDRRGPQCQPARRPDPLPLRPRERCRLGQEGTPGRPRSNPGPCSRSAAPGRGASRDRSRSRRTSPPRPRRRRPSRPPRRRRNCSRRGPPTRGSSDADAARGLCPPVLVPLPGRRVAVRRARTLRRPELGQAPVRAAHLPQAADGRGPGRSRASARPPGRALSGMAAVEGTWPLATGRPPGDVAAGLWSPPEGTDHAPESWQRVLQEADRA